MPLAVSRLCALARSAVRRTAGTAAAPAQRPKRGAVRLVLAALILAAVPLAGCGKKPGGVTAPQGEENDTFPRTYPSE